MMEHFKGIPKSKRHSYKSARSITDRKGSLIGAAFFDRSLPATLFVVQGDKHRGFHKGSYILVSPNKILSVPLGCSIQILVIGVEAWQSVLF